MFKLKKYLGSKMKYQDPSINADCREFEINNWIISEFLLEKLVPVVGVHPFPLNELMLMSSAVCRFKPEFIFEWGTHIGKSARIFYETNRHFNINCSIHSIDLPDNITHAEHPGEQRGYLVKGKENVNLHQGDGINIAMEIYRKINSRSRVLFFVDGDHSFVSVKKELFTIIKEVYNPIILLHDTFYQSKESKYNIGPFEAIQDVLKEEKADWNVIATQTGLPGMTLIYKR